MGTPARGNRVDVATEDGDSRCSDPARRRLLVAFDAVLNVSQLSDVRRSVADRVAVVCPEQVFDCQLAVQELCLAVLVRSGLCSGLRVYDCAGVVRVEVDEPADGALSLPRTAHGIVETLARRRGVDVTSGEVRAGVDPRPGVSTAWCELDVAE